MKAAELNATIAAPIESVFRIITDYASYPRFLTEMKAVKILEQSKGCSVVQFTLHLIKEFQYILEFEEKGPTVVRWKLREGDLFRVNDGGWELKAEGKNTSAIYRLQLDLKLLVPKMVEKALVNNTLPQTVKRFKERIESKEGGHGRKSRDK